MYQKCVCGLCSASDSNEGAESAYPNLLGGPEGLRSVVKGKGGITKARKGNKRGKKERKGGEQRKGKISGCGLEMPVLPNIQEKLLRLLDQYDIQLQQSIDCVLPTVPKNCLRIA